MNIEEGSGIHATIDDAVRAVAARLRSDLRDGRAREVLEEACGETVVKPGTAMRCGRALLAAGLIDEADIVFDALARLFPGSPQGLVGQARVAMQRRNWKQGLALWTAVFKDFASRREAGWMVGRATCQLETDGPTDDTLAGARRALEAFPDDSSALTLVTQIERLRGSKSVPRQTINRLTIDEAVRAAALGDPAGFGDVQVRDVLDEACREPTIKPSTAMRCARVLLAAGQADEAELVYEALARLLPGSPQGLMGQAKIAMVRRDWRRALALWTDVLQRHPSRREASWMVARAACRLEIDGPTEETLDAARQAVEAFPEDSSALALVARIETLRSDRLRPDSRADCQPERRPTIDEAVRAAAARFAADLTDDRVKDVLDDACRAPVVKPTAAMRCARVLLAAGRTDEAELIYETLAAFLPESPQGLMGQAKIAMARQDWRRALALWTDVLQRHPSRLEASWMVARAMCLLETDGPTEGVLDAARQAVAAFPDDSDALGLERRIARLRGGTNTVPLPRMASSIDAAVRAVARRCLGRVDDERVREAMAAACREPKVKPAAAMRCARVLLAAGLADDADLIYDVLARFLPVSPQGLVGQARVAMQRQSWEAALALWAEVFTKYPSEREAGWMVADATCRLELYGATEETLDAARRALEAFPDELNALALVTRIATLRRDHPFALDLWRGYFETPRDSIAPYLSAMAFAETGADQEFARSIVARAPPSLSSTPEFRYRVVLRLHELTLDEAAGLALLQEGIDADLAPGDLARIGNFLVNVRQAPRAVELLGEGLARDPTHLLLVDRYLFAVWMARGLAALLDEKQRLLPGLRPADAESWIRTAPTLAALTASELNRVFGEAILMPDKGAGFISKFVLAEDPDVIPDFAERLSKSGKPSFRLVGRLLAARQADARRLSGAVDLASAQGNFPATANELADCLESSIDAMVEHHDGSADFLDAITMLQRNSHRAKTAWLNSRETYFDAAAFADWLADRVRARLPTSVIRIGDGEGNFLPYPPEIAAHLARDRRQVQLQRWWGEEKFPGLQAEEFSRRLQASIASADAIGLMPAGRLMALLYREKQPNRSTRGLLSGQYYFDHLAQDVLSDKIVTSLNIPIDLDQWDLYGRILGPASAVSVVACHDLAGFLDDRFGLPVRRWFEVPEAKAFTAMFGRSANRPGPPFYPDVFDAIMADISPLPGEVVLVAAGILGKLICDRVRERGGVGLDIGSLSDYWAGYATRAHARSALGNLPKALAGPSPHEATLEGRSDRDGETNGARGPGPANPSAAAPLASILEQLSASAGQGSDNDADAISLDPVGRAAGGSHHSEISLPAALDEARDLVDRARVSGAPRGGLPRVLDLVRQFPHSMELQMSAARLLDEGDKSPTALIAWNGILERFPSATEPFRMVVRMTRRLDGPLAALAVFHRRFPDPARVVDMKPLLALAAGYEELDEPSKAEQTYRIVTGEHPTAWQAWRHLIRLQEARGDLIGARDSAAQAVKACRRDELVHAHTRLVRAAQVVEELSPDIELGHGLYTAEALNAICGALIPGREIRDREPPRLGSTLLIGASLKAGGAERQLTRTAVSLNDAARAGRRIGGHDVVGPVAVACRSTSPTLGNDFYLGVLTDAGVPVIDYERLALSAGDVPASRVAMFSELVDLLPARMKDGVFKLVDLLRSEAPDVVQIWQDLMVFNAGLAALIAGVPRIVLSMRNLPEIDRVDRWRPELEPVYRFFLDQPGVVMTANSAIVARRWEAWMGLSKGAVSVIYNGVARLDDTPAAEDEAVWDSFAQRTAGADFTVGAVMRMHADKRPLEWLAIAERFRRRRPGARFLMVGEGALLEEARECAHRLGFADRVLFTGLSSSVGYWLTRMDALMLVSRWEGLPNVLIEAQLAGVPVVATPAGGAPETLLNGETGWILSNAEELDLEEAVGRLVDISSLDPPGLEAMRGAARQWAERAFSVDTMLERTVRVFMAPQSPP